MTDEFAGCSIGIDVGGTKIAAGILVLPEGRTIVRRQQATDAGRGGEAVLVDVILMAEELRDEGRRVGVRPETIGVGVAELVNRAGDVVSGATIDWRGVAVRERVGAVLPTVIEADVRAAALAEARLGAGQGFSSFVFVTIGTGISSCLVTDGLPVPGCRGLAGTLASGPTLAVTPEGELLSGLPLELFASGPALVARLNRVRPGAARTGLEVVGLAAARDPIALQVVRSAGRATGAAVAHFVDILDPSAVIVGGGLGLAGGVYWDAMDAAIHELIWSDLHRHLPVIPAGLGNDSGWVGAALAGAERACPVRA